MNTLLKAAIAAVVLQWSLLVPAATAQEISANLSQTGAGNLAAIEQANIAYSAVAVITQAGNDNIAGGTAEGLAGITQINSDSVEARIAQTGNRNVANLGQDAAYITSAEITQRGNDNVAVTRQKDTLLSGIVASQTGQRNSAQLLQDSVFPFLIKTSQTGMDNDIVITERAGGFAGPVVTQEGNGNRARVEQYLDYYSGIRDRKSVV